MTEFVGKKLKTLHEEAGLTLEELAKTSDINIEQLKEIVEDKITPSSNIVGKICDALDIRIGTLLDGSDSIPISIVRDGTGKESKSYTTDDTAHKQNLTYTALTKKPNRAIDPYLIEVSNKPLNEDALESHEGEEFMYILEGVIEFRYGSKIIELYKGDSIYFDSLIPHCMRANSEESAKIISTHYSI